MKHCHLLSFWDSSVFLFKIYLSIFPPVGINHQENNQDFDWDGISAKETILNNLEGNL